ncbi:hypothetical protein ACX0G9_30065 [Flavitalea flava]
MNKHLKITVSLFAGLLCLADCKEVNLPLTEIIHFVNPGEETLAADNFTTLKVTAVIPHDASAANRSIKFTTDAGQFSNDSNEITEIVDDAGEASVYFHADKAAKATITATVSTFSVTKTVNCTAVDISSLIRFDNFDKDSLVADNLTERVIDLVIDKNTPQNQRQVALTTDLGSFTNQQQTITIVAGSDGTAKSAIKSDMPGTANITAVCHGFTTATTLTFIAPDPDAIVRFADGQIRTVPADGVTTLDIKTLINNNTVATQRKVTFATDQGTFSNSQSTQEVTPDAKGFAVTTLKSAVEGTASVTITHRNITRTMAFTFTRAYPDGIALNSDFTINAGIGNKITIQAQLIRSIGKSSPGIGILFTAADNMGHTLGQFKNAILSSTDGLASIDFSAGSGSYRGPVTITAVVKDMPAVTASMVVTVVD